MHITERIDYSIGQIYEQVRLIQKLGKVCPNRSSGMLEGGRVDGVNSKGE
jgi:hypothetical protein